MPEIPSRFAATGADTAIAITRAKVNHRIGLSASLPPGHLDADRLARAVRLSFDAEPVVGCAFRTDERRAYWQRLPDLGSTTVLLQEGVTDPDAMMRSFQAVEVGDEGPQAAVALFRAAERDVVGIKVSHVLADGHAAKQYAYLLADIYSRLKTDPAFIPEPNLRERPSGRDVWANLSPEQRREARKAKSWTSPTWPAPETEDPGSGPTYQWVTLPPELFVALKSYGSDRGCTVNDVMLTAVLRACISSLDPPAGVPLSLMYTADLRRYLHDAGTLPISNVSISGSLDIERVNAESFEDTLRRVHQRMQRWAEMCHGAGPLASAERIAGLGYRMTERLLGLAFRAGGSSGKTYPWFTNIGIIDDARMGFDGVAPDSGFMFGPGAVGVSIVPVISTYRDALTVSMGYCDSDENAQLVEELLGSIAGELRIACTPKSA
jgi:NRPS condensation-like uncharacterized protein